VVKLIFLLGAAYVWNLEYNNSRADGSTPRAAAAIATARTGDPGLEMAWDFGWSVGTGINNGINNLRGGG
jgi:hypothetical protein